MQSSHPLVSNPYFFLLRSNSFSKHAASKSLDVPKDYLVVYVGEGEKKRFVIPISFLNKPTFQQLLNKAKEGLLYVIFIVHIVMNFSEGL
ncbi:hypothetical protein ACB094_11G041500 [Castanea mollissima]